MKHEQMRSEAHAPERRTHSPAATKQLCYPCFPGRNRRACDTSSRCGTVIDIKSVTEQHDRLTRGARRCKRGCASCMLLCIITSVRLGCKHCCLQSHRSLPLGFLRSQALCNRSFLRAASPGNAQVYSCAFVSSLRALQSAQARAVAPLAQPRRALAAQTSPPAPLPPPGPTRIKR